MADRANERRRRERTDDVPVKQRDEALVGIGTAMRAVDAEIDYAARSDAGVLITGESGVGKKVIARLIHQRSRRAHTPLVTLNCGGIPTSRPTFVASRSDGHYSRPGSMDLGRHRSRDEPLLLEACRFQ